MSLTTIEGHRVIGNDDGTHNVGEWFDGTPVITGQVWTASKKKSRCLGTGWWNAETGVEMLHAEYGRACWELAGF